MLFGLEKVILRSKRDRKSGRHNDIRTPCQELGREMSEQVFIANVLDSVERLKCKNESILIIVIEDNLLLFNYGIAVLELVWLAFRSDVDVFRL